MQIEVYAPDFVKLLNKFLMSNTQEIVDGILKFGEEGFFISALTSMKTSQSELAIDKEFFHKYEPIGNIGIGSLKDFISILRKFKGNCILKKEENLLTITMKRKELQMGLVNEDFITNKGKKAALEYIDFIEIDASILNKEVFDFTTAITSVIDEDKDFKIKIEYKESKLIFKVTGKYKYKFEFITDKELQPLKIEFTKVLKECINKLDGRLILRLKNDYPLTVEEVGKLYKLKFIIAPANPEE